MDGCVKGTCTEMALLEGDNTARVAAEDIAVVTCGPHNFAGAGTIHARLLTAFADRGFDVAYSGMARTFRHDDLWMGGVRLSTPHVKSDAYGGSDALATVAIASNLFHLGREAHRRGRRVVLLGSYLIPFYGAVVQAAALLRCAGIPCVTIAIPAGSDVWQIGSQVPDYVQWLLSDQNTDAVVTYSRAFADEVQRLARCAKAVHVIFPPVDGTLFHPIRAGDRSALRRGLRLETDSFVMLNCSNMRPVKQINNVVSLAIAAAETLPRRDVILLLVGPVTPHLGAALPHHSSFVDRTAGRTTLRIGRLTVIIDGLRRNTPDYHRVSDIALNASVHDSFNLSLAESLSCGVPIVSSSVVGLLEALGAYKPSTFTYSENAMTELVQRGQVFLPKRAVEQAVRSIFELAVTPGLATLRGSQGAFVVQNSCSVSAIGKEWSDLIVKRAAALSSDCRPTEHAAG
jgi:glycosyltransferase involved in cell wall biosynthesis